MLGLCGRGAAQSRASSEEDKFKFPGVVVEAGEGPTMNVVGMGAGFYYPLVDGGFALEPFLNVGAWTFFMPGYTVGWGFPVYTPGLRASVGGTHRIYLSYGQGIYNGPRWYDEDHGLTLPLVPDDGYNKLPRDWVTNLVAIEIGYELVSDVGVRIRAGLGDYAGSHAPGWLPVPALTVGCPFGPGH